MVDFHSDIFEIGTVANKADRPKSRGVRFSHLLVLVLRLLVLVRLLLLHLLLLFLLFLLLHFLLLRRDGARCGGGSDTPGKGRGELDQGGVCNPQGGGRGSRSLSGSI